MRKRRSSRGSESLSSNTRPHLAPSSLYYFWDADTNADWPTHDPCGSNAPNQNLGVIDPRGAIYVRRTNSACMPLTAALEVPHRFGDVAAQLAWIERALPAADLVVLPETCLTGYVGPGGNSDLAPFAEPRGGATEQALRALAKRTGRALLAPLIEKAGTRSYNSALFIDADGEVLAHYRKRHPWLLEAWATPGDLAYPLFEWRGLKLSIAICFDAQFLAAGTENPPALAACDVLLFPSAWTEFPPETREELLASISRKSGCAVVNANWGKGQPRVPGQGRSLILGCDGELISEGSAPQAELSARQQR